MVAEFAQIVGLLAAFNSGREATKSAELSEFLAWLTEHGHQDIKDAIDANHDTTISMKAFMNLGLQEVNEKLDYISAQTAVLSCRLEGTEGLARAYITEQLSDQSMQLLSLMDEHETEYFLESREIGQGPLCLILSQGPNFECPETRFYKDDIEMMLGLGLLRKDYSSHGTPMYFSTRAASQLVQARRQSK